VSTGGTRVREAAKAMFERKVREAKEKAERRPRFAGNYYV
jgi:hypothetical protein